MLVLAAAGARQFAGWILTPPHQPRAAGAIFGGLALLSMALSLPVNPKAALGFIPVVEAMHAMMPPASAALLISDYIGEGAVISEFALRQPKPAVYLVRGTKLLASQDWNQGHYRGRVHSGEECARLLASVPIDVLVLDRRRSVHRTEFFGYVDAMLRSSREWTLVKEFQAPGDSPYAIALYCRRAGIEPARNLPGWIVPEIPWLN
jgi:hypothetical protein